MWKMRTLCDVCEAAPAQLFCAADEAALCIKCDEKVHGCNKLANRHVRLQLGEARAVPKCDICESAPAFFFCGIDGTSLCLQCDMDVHIGGKKTHERYLMMGQRVELPARQLNTEDPMGEGNDQGKYHQGYINGTRSLEWNNSDAPAVAIALLWMMSMHQWSHWKKLKDLRDASKQQGKKRISLAHAKAEMKYFKDGGLFVDIPL